MDCVMTTLFLSSPARITLLFSRKSFSSYVPSLIKMVLGVAEASGRLLMASWILLKSPLPSFATTILLPCAVRVREKSKIANRLYSFPMLIFLPATAAATMLKAPLLQKNSDTQIDQVFFHRCIHYRSRGHPQQRPFLCHNVQLP